MGHIYPIGQSDTPNVFKIGCTKRDVGKRTKTLQTGNSEELYLARSFETDKPFKLEKMLHNHFSNQMYLNEWYSLSDDDVKNFIDVCRKYQSNIDSLADNPFF